MVNKKKADYNLKNIALWSVVTLLTLLAFFCTQEMHFTTPVKLMVWIGWLLVSMLTAYFTTQGQKTFSFAKESKIELQKVVWPTRQEAVQITLIVMVMVTIAGVLLWGVDTLMIKVIGKITHLG